MDYLKETARIRNYLKEEKQRNQKKSEAHSAKCVNNTNTDQRYDHPQTIGTATAIMLYILTMVVGSVFNDRIYIYIGATLALICFLCRHKFKYRNKK